MKRFWIFILIAGFAFLAMSAFQYYSRPGKGDVAPGFLLPTLDGESIQYSEYSGRPKMIHFWATWCGYCRKEFPSLNRLQDDFKDSGFIILAISEDEEGSEKALKYFLDETPANFPILMDTNGAVADSYSSFGMPESILVDADGVIFKRFSGGAYDWDGSEVRKTVREFIESGGK